MWFVKPCRRIARIILHVSRISHITGPPGSEVLINSETCDNDPVSPTVLQSGPYRFFFFSSDKNEPVHVHGSRDRKTAKFWLSPVRVAYNYGFAAPEFNRVAALVRQHEADLVKAWHEYFKSSE